MAAPMPALLSEEVAELVASGVSIYVATVDAELEPESIHAIGARVHPDSTILTVYLPDATSAKTRENVENGSKVAVTLARPVDHKSLQVKGTCRGLRRSNGEDRAVQSMGRAALVEQFVTIGVPRVITRRLNWWPSWALDVAVDAVYLQTPGPAAGEPLGRQP